MQKISLVVPCFNESLNIHAFHKVASNLLKTLDKKYKSEIIFIDDGSSDDTLTQLISLRKKDSHIKIIELSRNFGKEAALTAGLKVSSGDAVIPMDADLQDPIDLIPEMISHWERGAEVVLARRVDRTEDSWIKRSSSSLFYKLHNAISSVKIPNNVGDFRLMDRVVIEAINDLPEQQRFMKGLFSWVGFKTVTLDYKRKKRNAGVTKFSPWGLWNLAIEGITSFSSAPLKIWFYIGLMGSIFSISYGIITIIKTLIFGIDLPGYASILVTILFFGSLQFIGIGMLGEYIGRNYKESKHRPIYIIRKKYGFDQ